MANAVHGAGKLPDGAIGTGRLEAFSDGVFAIAITLLVLDVKVPRLATTGDGAHLMAALLEQWPTYLAYVTSFVTILIMWINHHTIIKSIRYADHTFLLLNGFLLLLVTFVPFPTSLLAEYIQHEGEIIGAALYSGTFVVIAVAYNLLWWYATANGRLIAAHVTPAFQRRFSGLYLLGPLLYLLAFAAAFINVSLSVALCIALAIAFALPVASFKRMQ